MKVLYIVIPCYNEEEVISETNRRILSLLSQMESEGIVSPESRILYVDDGSHDKTWELIEQFHRTDERVSGVKLAGNSGHQNALMAGLSVAKDSAEMIISIDADLQDDIEVIPVMVRKYHEGCDIVYGVRKERKSDTWFKRNTALAFYKLIRFLGVKSVYNHADFRLMSSRAVEQLCNYRERNLFLRGIIPLIGYRTDVVYYDRTERLAGESKYPLSKMLNFAVDGITSFSVKPVRLIFMIGVGFLFVSFFLMLYALIRWGLGRTINGWTSLILSIWFIGGFNLIGLGVVGEYIGKIYIETKDRPRYNIEKTI